MMSEASTDEAYEGYEVWKGWDNLFSHDKAEAAYFSKECAEAKISEASVLEIGFGAGVFLSWADTQAAKLSGIEINPVLIDAACAKGITMLPADFETVAEQYKHEFDTIVAFDVFEHFTLDEISVRLLAVKTMLKPGGTLILRFPNGQSPLGLGPQHGDPTHLTPLSKAKLEPYLRRDGWTVIRYSDAVVDGGGDILKTFIRKSRVLIRKIIAKIISIIYAIDHPWGPVVTLVLKSPMSTSGLSNSENSTKTLS